jgi:ATP-dependent RNA helicase DDX31/DBP7
MAAGSSLVAAGLDARLVTGAARIAGMAPAFNKEDPVTHGQFDLKPTSIQKLLIPHAVAGRHCVGLAATGSGKTLSYVLPVLQYLVQCSQKQRIKRDQGTYAVMLTPTRELAEQVAAVLNKFQSAYSWLVASELIGGASRKSDKSRLRKGVTILVATPGRLLDHLQNTNTFSMKRLAWLVLDEFDRLLDMGFAEAIAGIVSNLKRRSGDAQLQVLATSATLTPEAAEHLDSITRTCNNEVGVALVDTVHSVEGTATIVTSVTEAAGDFKRTPSAGGAGDESLTFTGKSVGTCDHHWCSVNIKWRFPTIVGLAAYFVGSRSRKMLLFLSTRQEVQHFCEALTALWPGLPGIGPDSEHFIGSLHGGMGAQDRQKQWKSFAAASSGLLLATDVAARGLDAPAVHVIVQCALPSDPADYVHRAGRTARMGRRGTSILMLQPHEQQYVSVLAGIGVEVSEASTTPWLSSLAGHVPPLEVLPPPPAAGDGNSTDAPVSAAAGEGNVQSPGMHAMAIMKSTREEGAGARPAGAAAGAAKRWQVWYESFVEWSPSRAERAASSFAAYTRAYSTHSRQLKDFLHVKALHLGHVAKCFGLRSQPSEAGAGSSKLAQAAALPAHLAGKRSAAIPSYRKKAHNSMSEFAS